MTSVLNLSTEALSDWLQSASLEKAPEKALLQLVDVRTVEEYLYLGHLPGSKLIPLHELPERFPELDSQVPTVVLCQHGVRSVAAADFLAQQGFTRLYNLADGLCAWEGPLEVVPLENRNIAR